jgi:cytidine deaminase
LTTIGVEETIIEAATGARNCALAQFSNFCVGAALEA